MKHGYLASLSLVALLGMVLAPLVQAKEKSSEWIFVVGNERGDDFYVKPVTFTKTTNQDGAVVGRVLTEERHTEGHTSRWISEVTLADCQQEQGFMRSLDVSTKERINRNDFALKTGTTVADIAGYICARLDP